MNLEKVALVTDVDFWRYGAGHRSRIASLVGYLNVTTELTVVLLNCPPARYLDKRYPGCRFIFLERQPGNAPAAYTRELGAIIRTGQINVCIIEYIHLSYLLEGIPPGTRVMLDTHDIISEREEAFIRFGYLEAQGRTMTGDQEIGIFNKYDKVMLIQADDYSKITGRIGREKTLLVPHAVPATPQPLRDRVRTIGFVGSTYLPNVDGITWFIREVWPAVAGEGITLNLYGNVCNRVSDYPGVVKRGFVPRIQEVYGEIDIAVNPVRFGAGLKIKNVEALCSGLPLVTHPHGAQGLEAGARRAFLVAATAGEFARHLALLAADAAVREELSRAAVQMARDSFSPRVCYLSLLEEIYQREAVLPAARSQL